MINHIRLNIFYLLSLVIDVRSTHHFLKVHIVKVRCSLIALIECLTPGLISCLLKAELFDFGL